MNKFIIGAIAALGVSSISHAGTCPNLSGVYDLSFMGAADGKVTFTQTGCELVTWTFSSDTTPTVLKVNGIKQLQQSNNAEPLSISGTFEGTCLVTNEYNGDDQSPADQTSYCLDSRGNLTETVTSYRAVLGTVMPPFSFTGVKE